MSVLLLFHFHSMQNLVPIRDTRKVATVTLKSVEGGIVEIYQESRVGAIRSLSSIHDNFEKAIRLLISQIKDWNIADGEGENMTKAPIDIEHLDRLSQEDLTLMLATSQDMTVEELEQKGKDIIAGNIKKNMVEGSVAL